MNLLSPSVFRDLLTDVFLNLFRKKLRALLTMTGVIIGSFLVVLILSLSHGLSEFLDQQIRAVWDERMIKVRLKKGGAPEKMAKGMFGGLGEPPQEVKEENEEEIPGAFKFRHIPHESIDKLKKIDGVVAVQPEIWVMPRSMQVMGDAREFDAIVRPWIMAGPDMLAYGKDFTSDQARECIVSEAYLVALGYKDPNRLIGKTVKIRVQEDAYIAMAGGGQMDLKFLDKLRDIAYLMRNPPEDPELAMISTFVMLRDLANSSEIQALTTKPGVAKEFEAKVVGVSKKGLLTNIIYLPPDLIAEMGRVFLRNPDMYKMDKSGKFGIEGLVQVRSAKDVPRIKKEVKKLDMKATTLEDVVGFIHGLFTALSAILSVFVMIAGVVAFFSIVNTLFMAVSERKREIGVLQAIGATRGYVAAMFAAEAGAIGLIGGMIGYLFGKLLCLIGNIYASQGLPYVPGGNWGHILGVSDLFVTPWWLLPLMMLGGAIVGALAGVLPAMRAAKLDPAEALRYE
ncbi:MAG: ABC transporter permease [Verrucomicrobiota bacterium]|nr:ABC transporter permease [Verrucomicrobiota bacterium]